MRWKLVLVAGMMMMMNETVSIMILIYSYQFSSRLVDSHLTTLLLNNEHKTQQHALIHNLLIIQLWSW